MRYCAECDWQIEIARRLVRKDKKQRWVYHDGKHWQISETPLPYKDKVSVYWMPIVGAVCHSWSPRQLAHNAI